MRIRFLEIFLESHSNLISAIIYYFYCHLLLLLHYHHHIYLPSAFIHTNIIHIIIVCVGLTQSRLFLILRIYHNIWHKEMSSKYF